MVAKEIRELSYINIGLVSQSKPYVHCRTSVSIARSREKVMQFARRQFLCLAAVGAALPGVPRLARGQAYPSRPVRIVVGFPPGGDMLPRLMGQWLSERLGQPFVIENRPGAGSNIATEMVVNAPPDGYTLLLMSPAQAVNATLYEKLNYNFVRDIAPVASFSREPNVMVVNSSVSRPRRSRSLLLTSNCVLAGSTWRRPATGPRVHVVGELFKMMTGVSMMHVPYRGAALAMTDLLSGQVQVMFATMPSSIAYVRSGKLRALAVTTTTPSAALPDVPAMGDFVPGLNRVPSMESAYRGTHRKIVDKLNREINAALADTNIMARIADVGGTALAGSPADFGKLIAEETEKWAKAIRFAGIKAQ